ncbi:MAG: RagB/SusD family nutrient uptake outer membrane protein [Prevotella sp.]|nr:RagB/SusD family nutrient uptake outer membrane protein [Prevotella sp.]
MKNGKRKSHFSLFTLVLLLAATLTSCNDWIDVKPTNAQVTQDYWKSKEEVEAVLMSGYYQLREAVPTLIKWGELRGGTIYSQNATEQKIQDFTVLPTNSLCSYQDLYRVISYANSVIHYAPGVQSKDNTYYTSVLNAHLAEAYFLRAYCYLILVKNFRDVPLVTVPYVDDSNDFSIGKSSDTLIIEQIKKDCQTALETGAARGVYSVDWETKGRVTKWALYALMADACLWSEDYETCKQYCDLILNATDAFRPVFLSNTNDWYTLFYPGASNEGIFEITWSSALNPSIANNFSSLFPSASEGTLRLTTQAREKVDMESSEVATNKGLVITDQSVVGRMIGATYKKLGTTYIIWKYNGDDVGNVRATLNANFIVYRVAEIILMKAQAEAMTGNMTEAATLVNRIRVRAGLTPIPMDEAEQYDEQVMIEEILNQKEMEFIAEGKRWYDILWYSRVNKKKYRNDALSMIIYGNQTTNADYIKSVLTDDNAWYLPLPQSDIEHNQKLKQNPYYDSSK